MAAPRPTLLVVDDQPPLLRLLVRALELEGYEVLAAEDGTRALELHASRADDIEAVILDVIIPPNGGAEVLEALWARAPELPVVLTSGEPPGEALRTRLAEGNATFVPKPFDPQALLETLVALRDRARSERDRNPVTGGREPDQIP